VPVVRPPAKTYAIVSGLINQDLNVFRGQMQSLDFAVDEFDFIFG
jgi:hypothetical protein